MPRRCVPTKDVASQRYGWGSRVQALIPPSPNGATQPPLAVTVSVDTEGTGGTETSHVPRGTDSTPVVAASEPGQAQTRAVSS